MVQLDEVTRLHLTSIMASAMAKLKASMDDGPGGKNAELTADESAIIYRTLTEVLGVRI